MTTVASVVTHRHGSVEHTRADGPVSRHSVGSRNSAGRQLSLRRVRRSRRRRWRDTYAAAAFAGSVRAGVCGRESGVRFVDWASHAADFAPDALLVVDPDGIVLWGLPSAYARSGHGRRRCWERTG